MSSCSANPIYIEIANSTSTAEGNQQRDGEVGTAHGDAQPPEFKERDPGKDKSESGALDNPQPLSMGPELEDSISDVSPCLPSIETPPAVSMANSQLLNVPSTSVTSIKNTHHLSASKAGTNTPTLSLTSVLLPAASTAPATRVGTVNQTPGRNPVITVPRFATSVQNGTPRPTQTTTIQLPANFQIPQGMVLIRSDNGQLMLVSQQALAQAQAQGVGLIRPAVATSTPIIRTPVPQATGASVVRKPVPSTAVKTNFLQSCQVTPAQRLSQEKILGTTVSAVTSSTIKTVTVAGIPSENCTTKLQRHSPPTTEGAKETMAIQGALSSEVLENVKKCKNFLVTLVKLASSGTHSVEMAKNVKELVQNLLDGKLEAEEFTNRLYTELKSSPQPYLVPFLKRSLPAVRQLTPDSQLFIQQCVLQTPQSAIASSASILITQQNTKPVMINSRVLQPSCSLSTTVKQSQPEKPANLVIQQQKGNVIKSTVATTIPQITAQSVNKVPPATQTCHRATGTVVKQTYLPPPKLVKVQLKNSFRENLGSTFRDEDDINDVASMAGVNLNEENARILATNSELVGSVIRSCRDEPFLQTPTLQKKILELGMRHGIIEVNPDVLNLVSHATLERLRELVEKLTVIAQHRALSYKDDDRYKLQNETRSQLKFLEQLDRLEKQRKDEEEREMLLRAAKSRSNKEDPEQLRLKQKAKEMQQLELAQIQQRDANITALAAIGPRKKRPFESLSYGCTTEAGSGIPPSVSQSVNPKQFCRQRTTRANLRDLIFCMEQEKPMRHSLALYHAFLK
ncbi:transcription initiation factor TFIID subunit 4-like isoform X2 [Erpetoichthys calabaricus]|uniref:transcription initiation factor TFIID subunit 4-like isoform X2 n=1 Tax=Erpetoichthys calabaricus TaxID=27687 RepID=UPI00223461EF|nr:transcription initiation factor TFIID subunit 4-like isoform X2 [Erpetoichthys calabaricus]